MKQRNMKILTGKLKLSRVESLRNVRELSIKARKLAEIFRIVFFSLSKLFTR